MSHSAAKSFDLNGKEWLLIFAAAVIIHILLFYLFQPMAQEQQDYIQDSRFTIFLNEEELNKKKDYYQLAYWLKYTGPEGLLYPDMKNGFSAVCGHSSRTLPNPVHFQHNLFNRVAEYDSYVQDLPDSRTLECFSFWNFEPAVRHPTHRRTFVEEPEYPLWSDDTGRVYSGLFVQDAADIRLVRQSSANRPTVLKLQAGPNRLPVITVVHSCGNSVLDLLAQRQLSSLRDHYNLTTKIERYYHVIWSRPQSIKSYRSIVP